MISINKTILQKPERLNDEKVAKKLIKIKDEQEPGKKITGYNHKDIRDKLLLLYQCGDVYEFNIKFINDCKCAYCETKISRAAFTERIDHYRPKDTIRIIDAISIYQIENDKPYNRKLIQVLNKSRKPHRGYFWLGYEWTNLLPTCSQCNLKKSNIFPLENEENRISDDLDVERIFVNDMFDFKYFKGNSIKLKSEEPLLLNPELDKVEKHLLFHGNGEVEGLTKKGKVSIAVYDLNRIGLISARRKLIHSIKTELIYALIDWANYNKPIQDFFNKYINDLDQSYKEYSRLGYFIKHKFNQFITAIFKQDKAYSDYIFIIENEYDIWKKRQNI